MQEYSKVMDVKTFSKEYGINLKKSYEIVHAKGFPMVKFGKRIVIIRSKVDEWLESNIGKEF
ncbi:helix-turn-helix domain-containing protein [Terrisporobacter petrolearius]|uniref:helix-turn-helix domain-containing protein n=1 Tax=Terrisporobacter petrolearius TaxID=1460447 RepID=UPI001D167653|nr:helix-turn-helix domain-containing protein [Terrisporobacter petrolearius]MCC3866319.1 helix-turn-helix domain-containing protein [Terrisporobacter petrolearius]